ncbi:MAG: MFS transporter, partial [Dehalococcoidia bacterium]
SHGARPVMLVGSVIMGAGVLLLRWVAEPWQLYAAFMLASVGFASTSVVPVNALMARWFERRRGLAVGITYTGLGAGGLLLTPLASVFITLFGWQTAITILALAVWGVQLPVVLLLVRSDPYEVGLLPDGIPEEGKLIPPSRGKRRIDNYADLPGCSLAEAAHTARFWMVAFLFLIALASSVGIFSQIQPFLVDLGYSSSIATLIISVNGGISIIAKFLYGYLSDRIPIKAILAFAALGSMTAPILMLVITTMATPRWLALVMSLVLGITATAFSTLVPIVSASAFGLRHVGAITGALGSAMLLGMAVGPALIGALFVATDGYTIAATIFTAGMVMAVVVLIIGPSLRYREPATPAKRGAAPAPTL